MESCLRHGIALRELIDFDGGQADFVHVLQQRTLPGQFGGHFGDLELEIGDLRCSFLRHSARHRYGRFSLVVDVDIAPVGDVEGCLFAVLVANVDHDTQTEAAPADQQQGDDHCRDRSPTVRPRSGGRPARPAQARCLHYSMRARRPRSALPPPATTRANRSRRRTAPTPRPLRSAFDSARPGLSPTSDPTPQPSRRGCPGRTAESAAAASDDGPASCRTRLDTRAR